MGSALVGELLLSRLSRKSEDLQLFMAALSLIF